MPQSSVIRSVLWVFTCCVFGLTLVLVTLGIGLQHGLPLGVWFVGGCLICLAVVWIGYVILRRMLDPLQSLSDDVRELAATDELTAIQITRDDEFGLLAASFNQMRQKLAQRFDQQQENSERLQTVLGSMVEGVIAVARDKTVIFANAASRQMLDFPRGEPIGRPLLELTRNRLISEAAAETFDASGDVVRELDTTGSPRRTLSLRATRLPGQPCPGIVIVLHDISDIRRLENLRREFVANVSHELKTPLAAVKAYAETLRLGAINDPEHNLMFVARIEEQADRLHELIIDILQIARIEAGQEAFDIVDVYLADVIEEALAQFADHAAARNISLTAEMPPDDLTVRGDEEGVRTVINNLVDNAIKYTPAEGRVTIHCHYDAATATVDVCDTGIGIGEQHLARIFERFYRADKARSREMGGTGLGLSIVKHLTQAFGGQVSVTSEEKKGSSFRVQFLRR